MPRITPDTVRSLSLQPPAEVPAAALLDRMERLLGQLEHVPHPAKLLLSKREVAALLSMSPSTVDNLRRELPSAVARGTKELRLWPREVVERYAREHLGKR